MFRPRLGCTGKRWPTHFLGTLRSVRSPVITKEWLGTYRSQPNSYLIDNQLSSIIRTDTPTRHRCHRCHASVSLSLYMSTSPLRATVNLSLRTRRRARPPRAPLDKHNKKRGKKILQHHTSRHPAFSPAKTTTAQPRPLQIESVRRVSARNGAGDRCVGGGH